MRRLLFYLKKKRKAVESLVEFLLRIFITTLRRLRPLRTTDRLARRLVRCSDDALDTWHAERHALVCECEKTTVVDFLFNQTVIRPPTRTRKTTRQCSTCACVSVKPDRIQTDTRTEEERSLPVAHSIQWITG